MHLSNTDDVNVIKTQLLMMVGELEPNEIEEFLNENYQYSYINLLIL